MSNTHPHTHFLMHSLAPNQVYNCDIKPKRMSGSIKHLVGVCFTVIPRPRPWPQMNCRSSALVVPTGEDLMMTNKCRWWIKCTIQSCHNFWHWPHTLFVHSFLSTGHMGHQAPRFGGQSTVLMAQIKLWGLFYGVINRTAEDRTGKGEGGWHAANQTHSRCRGLSPNTWGIGYINWATSPPPNVNSYFLVFSERFVSNGKMS